MKEIIDIHFFFFFFATLPGHHLDFACPRNIKSIWCGLSKLSNLSASIASRVYPNNSLSGQLVQSGGTRDRGVNIVSVPTKSGRLATMYMYI